MKKFIKRYVLTAIVINLVSIVYGAILSYVLQGENPSILFSCMEGLFVGFLVAVIYLILTFSFGYGFNQEDFNETHIKKLISFMNVVACILMCYGITILIENSEGITFTHMWMYIVNLLFSTLVIAKANYDGKKLRQALSDCKG